ncbi:MAG: hypothetical protein U9Q16_02310 [Patescibacteria group bacterium]|nr:hypothetical protein [Patescibacteria group bacterium]
MKYIFYFSFLSTLLALFTAFSLYCPVLASDTAGESIQHSTGNIIGNIIESTKQGLFKTIDWIKYIWNSYIKLWLKGIWQKINSFLGKEIENRKPEVQQEFEKEKQEMKDDIPNLWQKFKELINRE